jgi:hypothetical protein
MSVNAQAASRAAGMIREIFESGRPLTYIQSAEEQRVAKVLCEVAAGLVAPVWTWSATEGLRLGGAGFHRGASGHRHLSPEGFS